MDKTFTVGDLKLVVNTNVVKDMRFVRMLAHMEDKKRSEEARLVDFMALCDFLFGEENVDIIMDELAKDNDGVCSDEIFGAWLSGVLEEISDVKNS